MQPNGAPHFHIDRDDQSAKFWRDPVVPAGKSPWFSRLAHTGPAPIARRADIKPQNANGRTDGTLPTERLLLEI